jgi:hypothetical protein
MTELSNVELNVKEIITIITKNIGLMFHRRNYMKNKSFSDKILENLISDKTYNFIDNDIFLVHLDNDYNQWQFKNQKANFELYKEIYTKFHEVTKKIGLNQFFPVFENTQYYLENK